MSFIIEINGKDITTIEEIRENFDIDVLLSHRDNFDVWLAGWDYEDEAAQVRELPPELSDDDWLKKVCKIIGIPSATLTAAKRKRTSDAKKAEKAKAAEEEKQREADKQIEFIMPVDDSVFHLIDEPQLLCTGRVKQGKIEVGDIINICDTSEKILTSARILKINQYGKTCENSQYW